MSERYLHSNITRVITIESNDFERGFLEESATGTLDPITNNDAKEKVKEVMIKSC